VTAYDGLGAEVLAARLRAPGLTVLAEVTSTLDVLHDLAAQGAPAGTAVLADAQTRGRGRHGRTWSSPAGRGIWLGYLARPPVMEVAALLAVRTGLTVAAALEELGIDAALKWPNDVLVRDRKVAGILCETRWQGPRPSWVAIGLGINVHGPPPADASAQAGALDGTTPVTRVAVLERLLPRLQRLPQDGVLSAGELNAWARRDWLAGRALAEPIEGTAAGLDPDGALRIETRQGVRRALAGHVRLG
jgi:BirA family biotin operon repressor/biotin-[acetyl-CoA-carboxylase] ligase